MASPIVTSNSFMRATLNCLGCVVEERITQASSIIRETYDCTVPTG